MQTERFSPAKSDTPRTTTGFGFLTPLIRYQQNFSDSASPTNELDQKSFEIKDHFNVGRDDCNDLILSDPFVSSRHARVERKADHFIIRDLQSRNGTFLNGSRVSEATLNLGDRIRFGESTYTFSDTLPDRSTLQSKNPTWNAQLQRLPSFAATDFPILVTGPSGSGKEVLTRAIHKNSLRPRGPFISINCGALSESLIESELFGHTKGSFTGASSDRKGAFESARGGHAFS